jgi:hypothetical protein
MILILVIVLTLIGFIVMSVFFVWERAKRNEQDSSSSLVRSSNHVTIPFHVPADMQLVRVGDKLEMFSCGATPTTTTHNKSPVPRTIMQTYKTNSLPIKMAEAAVSLLKKNPHYSYNFFDDRACVDFLAKEYGIDSVEFKVFTMLIPGAFKSDVFRLAYLFKKGGFYLDVCMNTEDAYPSFDDLLTFTPDATCIFVQECVHTMKGQTGIYQAFLAAAPGEPCFRAVLDGILVRVQSQYLPAASVPFGLLSITGPLAFAQELNRSFGKDPTSSFELGFDPVKKIHFLKFINGKVRQIFLSPTNQVFLNAKYKDWQKDREKGKHYSNMFNNKEVYFKPTTTNFLPQKTCHILNSIVGDVMSTETKKNIQRLGGEARVHLVPLRTTIIHQLQALFRELKEGHTVFREKQQDLIVITDLGDWVHLLNKNSGNVNVTFDVLFELHTRKKKWGSSQKS